MKKITHGLSSLLDDVALDGLAETGIIRNRRSSAWHTEGREGACRRGGGREAGNGNKSKAHLQTILGKEATLFGCPGGTQCSVAASEVEVGTKQVEAPLELNLRHILSAVREKGYELPLQSAEQRRSTERKSTQL